jgi:hypothetical protein
MNDLQASARITAGSTSIWPELTLLESIRRQNLIYFLLDSAPLSPKRNEFN